MKVLAAQGEPVVLVRPEVSTDDIAGFASAAGILTAIGGRTAHAAVVARQMGKTCLVGCRMLRVDAGLREARLGDKVIVEGDWISLDGATGEIFLGRREIISERPGAELTRSPNGGRSQFSLPYDTVTLSREEREKPASCIISSDLDCRAPHIHAEPCILRFPSSGRLMRIFGLVDHYKPARGVLQGRRTCTGNHEGAEHAYNTSHVVWFEELRRADVPRVGGKNASLGETAGNLATSGVKVPPGFATTADAYWRFVEFEPAQGKISSVLSELESGKTSLADAGQTIPARSCAASGRRRRPTPSWSPTVSSAVLAGAMPFMSQCGRALRRRICPTEASLGSRRRI